LKQGEKLDEITFYINVHLTYGLGVDFISYQGKTVEYHLPYVTRITAPRLTRSN